MEPNLYQLALELMEEAFRLQDEELFQEACRLLEESSNK